MFTLGDGVYTIGVQAVDGRRKGSPFCSIQFAMTNGNATAIRSIDSDKENERYYNLSGKQVNLKSRTARKQILVSKNKKAVY